MLMLYGGYGPRRLLRTELRAVERAAAMAFCGWVALRFGGGGCGAEKIQKIRYLRLCVKGAAAGWIPQPPPVAVACESRGVGLEAYSRTVSELLAFTLITFTLSGSLSE